MLPLLLPQMAWQIHTNIPISSVPYIDLVPPIAQTRFPDRTKQALEAANYRQAQAVLAAQEAQVAVYTTPVRIIVSAPPGTAQCYAGMAQAGITDPNVAINIIMRESGCDPTNWNSKSLGVPWSVNRSCGIGQQLPCGKWPHAWDDPVGGMIDMQNYVMGKYGSWANAWSYWQAHGNY